VMPLAMELLLLRIRLPVPVTPPETVRSCAPLALLLVSVVPPVFTVNAVVVMLRGEIVLFSVTPVTFAPTPPLMRTEPAAVPELVIVPVLFTLVVESVMPLAVALLLLRIRLPVPVTPPDTVNNAVPAVFVKVVPPLFTVNAVVLRVRPAVVVFWVMAVTLVPTPPVMVCAVVLVLVLTMVPVLLTELVVKLTMPVVPVPLRRTLPVPVTPPDKVSPKVVVDTSVTSWLLNVMAPLKVEAALLVMVAVPVLPDATVIGFANGPANPPLNVALALPLPSPIVMTLEFAPNAFALVVPLTVPDLIVKPPVNVFTPLSTRVEVELFSTTPVTLVPMMLLIVVAPVPAPMLVTVPVLLTVAVESVRVPVVELLLMVRLLVPVTPPLKVVEIAAPVLPKVRVPVVPVAKAMGFAKVKAVVPTSNEAATAPLVLPKVTMLEFAPNALALTVPTTVPA